MSTESDRAKGNLTSFRRRVMIRVALLLFPLTFANGALSNTAAAQAEISGGHAECVMGSPRTGSGRCTTGARTLAVVGEAVQQGVTVGNGTNSLDIKKIISQAYDLLWLAALLVLLLIVAGTIIFLALFLNIKGLKSVLSKLRASNLETRNDLGRSKRLISGILAQATDAVIIFDSRGAIESVSHAVEAFFQYTAQELKGRRLSALVTGSDVGSLEKFLSGRTTDDDEAPADLKSKLVSGHRKDGTALRMSISVSELYLGEGRQFIAVIPASSLSDASEKPSTDGPQLRIVPRRPEAPVNATSTVARIPGAEKKSSGPARRGRRRQGSANVSSQSQDAPAFAGEVARD